MKEESSLSPAKVEKVILPAELFLQHLAAEQQAGNAVKSDKRKRSGHVVVFRDCLLYTSPSPRDYAASRMPSSA